MILLIDNYDSFTHNLARYLCELGREVEVVRNDAISVEGALASQAEAYVLSPGPGGPGEAGISVDLVRRAGADVPVLGVCLGLQCIGAAFGGRIVRSGPVHGKVVDVFHGGTDLFAKIPSPFRVTRYHSLAIDPDSLPPELTALGWTRDATLMAARHRKRPVWGVQFHPEALLTEFGHALLANFLALAGGHAPPGAEASLPDSEFSGGASSTMPGVATDPVQDVRRPTRRR